MAQLDEALMHRVLALPNKARSTDRYIATVWEFAWPPEYREFFEPLQEGYARLGLEALEIVDDLRGEYGVAVRSRTELTVDWDTKDHLTKHLREIEERAAKRRERMQRTNKVATRSSKFGEEEQHDDQIV